MPNIGPLELVLILLVVLLLFGAKRLPELGRSLGSGMKEFKDSVTGKDDSPDRAEIDRGEAPQPPQASAPAETPVEAEPRH
jgi:sec-independent protein translocase protein TatA